MTILDKGRYKDSRNIKNFEKFNKNFLTILTIFNYFREFTLTILVKLKIFEKY